VTALRIDRCSRLAALLIGAVLTGSQALATATAPTFDAEQWLERVQKAASKHSYRGTMIFSGGGIVTSSKVGHVSDGRQRYERIELLGGPSKQQLRHNDVVVTLFPQSRVAVYERQEPLAYFPALPQGSQRLLESYEPRYLGRERIAGLAADVVMLRPRDGLRYAQRLWAEHRSGLLMRADVLGPRGDVLESSAFTDLSLGERLPIESVTGPMKRLEGYRVLRPQAQSVMLDAEGWSLQPGITGFQLINCARRQLAAPVAGADDARPVIQAVYSDGLTHVSVFIEPYDAQRHRPMRTNLGATNTSMSRHGDWWVTVVGDVPMPTVEQFHASLHRR
jgi:sigma-E factor negative regulatory protein RseB